MSNLIPPLLSSSPPPIVGPLEEDDDDEFGDFRAAAESFDCDDFSLPPSPQKSPEKELKPDFSRANLDINCNKSQKATETEMPTQNLNGLIVNEEVEKDFQDKRKTVDDSKPCETEVNCSSSQSPQIFDIHESEIVSPANPIDEQIVNQEPKPEISSDQDKESQNCTEEFDDFKDFHCEVINCENNVEEIEHNVDTIIDKSSDVDKNDVISVSNTENLFDAFSESIQEKTNNSDDLSELNEPNEIKSEAEEINDEIAEGDEKDERLESVCEASSSKICETDSKLSEDDFGDFENHFDNEVEKCASEDDFDDFVNPLPAPMQNVEEVDDDFGDFESSEFADFSSHTVEKSTFLEVDEKNAVQKSETILKEMFPPLDVNIDEILILDYTKENTVFEQMKDVTETNALNYQWSKSNSQKMFFKALNIDTRNILYGPAWNSSMPRFAATLGLTPLEPVKSEILTPTPVQNASSPSNSSQKNNGDIPTAQFDWSGSGLINPLDSTSGELPGNVPENSSHTSTQADFLPTTSDKPEPVATQFDLDILEKITTESTKTDTEKKIDVPKSNDQSEEFSAFESPKLIPLRETHIFNELTDFGSKPGWLEPTIVTPDLPRKETVIDPIDADDEDEFDDFQMVLPEENKKKAVDPEIKVSSEPEIKLNSLTLTDLGEFETTSSVPPKSETTHNQEHIFSVPLSSGPIDSSVQKQQNSVKDDDDEFTEFHSSMPPAPSMSANPSIPSVPSPMGKVPAMPQTVLKPLQPVPMEPLKPTLQYSTPIAQINWPDPGVTDEDIRNIELTYSRKAEQKEEETKKVTKENSVEEDEWSDFVSVSNPIKPVLPERTSTPDLPLSVLNLNHVQAPKQPIPVITPSGLVQTKLSSNMQPKSVVQTSVQPSMFRPPTTQYQPSIISNQFAVNFMSGSGNTKSQDDDDDWSDFVSSQPPPQVNGYQQKSTFSQGKGPQINWTSATTNIIMNPTHFESFSGYAPPQSKKVTPMPSRNAVPTISAIPDLDFIAPKSRTSKK